MSANKVVEPEKGKNAFTCPRCGAYAKFDWLSLAAAMGVGGGMTQIIHEAAKCHHCGVLTLWAGEQVRRSILGGGGNSVSVHYAYRLVYPAKMTAPEAHVDLPQECADDFEEARQVLDLSPRASAALLRLVTEKLCRQICDVAVPGSSKGKSLNDLIGEMVARGLPATIQQALDSLRVIGNESVHPGKMDIKDNRDVALRLFGLVTVVVEQTITQPKKIAELYGTLPPEKVEGIAKRDN
jgi:hypothetical protein